MASKMLVALATLLCSASTQASRSDGGECLSNTALSYKNVSVPRIFGIRNPKGVTNMTTNWTVDDLGKELGKERVS